MAKKLNLRHTAFSRICSLNLSLDSVYILCFKLHIAIVRSINIVQENVYLVFLYLNEPKTQRENP